MVDKGRVISGALIVIAPSLREGWGGSFFFSSVQTHWAVQRYLCIACLPNACDSKPKKRQEISEFWCAENRLEVTRRILAGKYASFEPLSAIC